MMKVVMLSVTHKPSMLSAIMLNVVMLGAVAPKAVTLHRQGEGIPSFKKNYERGNFIFYSRNLSITVMLLLSQF